jgi:hypothetical protein
MSLCCKSWGEGHCGRFGGAPGDLLVKLQVGSVVDCGTVKKTNVTGQLQKETG